MLRNALEGLRVLDFSQMAAGPTCTMLLADMGAEVIKVEPPDGDLGRTLGPGWVGPDGALYHALNRNKQGICIDLKSAEGVATARRLVAGADVLVESMRPGVMDRLGLGYAHLHADHPRLVYCSISAYGQEGPYAARAGVDGILQADTGLMSLIGVPGAEPCKVQAPVVDIITGHIACTGVLAKLAQRARDGQGGHLDVNLMNCAIALQAPALASYLADGVLPTRIGSAAPYSAPNEAFETADGWIMVAAYMGDRWQRLCDTLDLPGLAEDERFRSAEQRTRHRAEMRAALRPAFLAKPTAAWIDQLLAADVLCARVADYDDLARHPQVHANGMLPRVDVPGHGALQLPGFPINSRQENQVAHRPAPRLGQDTRVVLRAAGLGEQEVRQLLTTGAARAERSAAPA
jgi:crotonobetainyl-CoA:carnitine CoA-transferase CaiB-like acyl-CoA transferase